MADSEPVTSIGVGRLSDSITELSQQIEVLRDVLDEIREDVSWAVRNDRVVALPIVCRECTVVKRMAIDPAGRDWGQRLQLEQRTVPQREAEQGIEAVTRTVESVIDQVATATIGLSWVRDEVNHAVENESQPSELDDSQRESSIPATLSTQPVSTREKPPPGFLF